MGKWDESHLKAILSLHLIMKSKYSFVFISLSLHLGTVGFLKHMDTGRDSSSIVVGAKDIKVHASPSQTAAASALKKPSLANPNMNPLGDLPENKRSAERMTSAEASVSSRYQQALLDAQREAEHLVKPDYPALAREFSQQGKVEIAFKILTNGKTTDVHLLKSSGFELLDESAVHTVGNQWLFTPYSQVREIQWEFEFQL